MGRNTRKITAQTLDEEITNAGVPQHGNQDPPLEEVANADQAMTIPQALSDRDIMEDFLKMEQSITNQALSITTQGQTMTSTSNREVVP